MLVILGNLPSLCPYLKIKVLLIFFTHHQNILAHIVKFSCLNLNRDHSGGVHHWL